MSRLSQSPGEPQGQGDHGESGANAGTAWEHTGIGHIEILQLVALPVRIHH